MSVRSSTMRRLVVVGLGLIILATVSGTASAVDPWRKEDTIRQAVWTGLLIIDYGQTRNIVNNPDKFEEVNPSLDAHPTMKSVNRHFLVAALVHPLVMYLLPTNSCLGPICDWRKAAQYVSIGVEAGIVGHNYNIGLKVDF